MLVQMAVRVLTVHSRVPDHVSRAHAVLVIVGLDFDTDQVALALRRHRALFGRVQVIRCSQCSSGLEAFSRRIEVSCSKTFCFNRTSGKQVCIANSKADNLSPTLLALPDAVDLHADEVLLDALALGTLAVEAAVGPCARDLTSVYTL